MKIFVLDLHCCPGHFLCGSVFSRIYSKTRMFPFRHTIFSWNYGAFRDISLLRQRFLPDLPQNQDVSLPSHHFSLELWCFPGHFLPTVAFSPANVAFFRTFPSSKKLSPGNEVVFRTFPSLERTISRKCGVFQDISILCTLEFSFSEIAVFKKSATLQVFLFPKKVFTHLL